MNALVLLAEANSGGQVEQIATTFGVDWPHLIAQIISFSIVCAILYKYAYGPILAMLEQRREQIAQGIANAEKIKAELDKTETQRREVMAQAHTQGARFIEEARSAAARLQQEESNKAMAAAAQIMAKAHEAAAQDHDRMLAELKREVGRLVVQASAAVTGKILTVEDQRRLSEETSRQITAER